MKLRLGFLSLLVLGLVLLGLGVGVNSGVTAQEEKIFITSMHSDMKAAHSYISSESGAGNTVYNAYVWGGMHPSLYGGTLVHAQPVPSLAAEPYSPFVQKGGLWCSTVKLLDGAQWSDGEPITAYDVEFTYNGIVQIGPGELGATWSLFDPDNTLIEGVKALDEHTVEFCLREKPGLAQWEYLDLGLPILPKHYWEPKFEEALASAEPAKTLLAFKGFDEPSAGGFYNVHWEEGAFVEVKANPNYSWRGTKETVYENGTKIVLPENLGGVTHEVGDTTGAVLGEFTDGPYVDAALYNVFGTLSAAALALINGDVDMQMNEIGYPKAVLDQLLAAPNVRVNKQPQTGLFYWSFNMRKSPFNYVGFRKAADCIIDREFVAEKLLAGMVDPLYGPVNPAAGFWYKPLTDEEKDARCVGFSLAEKLERAVQYLKEDGFTWEEEPYVDENGEVHAGKGLIDPEGNPVPELEHLHPNAAYDNNRNIFGLHIVDRMSLLGATVRDVPAGFNNIVDLVFDKQDFDMWQLGWRVGIFPDHVYYFFNSAFTEPGGYSPQGGFCSARENALNGCQDKFDELSEAFMAEQSVDQAAAEIHEMQAMLNEFLPYVTTHSVPQWDAWNPNRLSWGGLEDLTLSGGLVGGNAYRTLVQKVAK